MDAPPPLRFHFDYVSHYAYLAWTQIEGLAARHGREVDPVPVLFVGLLRAHGQKGPGEIPPKRVYVIKDVVRRARRLGVALVPPPAHPFNPLLALRVTAQGRTPEERRALTAALFSATWGGVPGSDTSRGVTDPAEVARVLAEAGLDGEALVAAAGGEEAKERLRQQTDDAVARGVFGVPTVTVGDEPFFGLDSLDLLEAFLRGEDPVVHGDAFAPWTRIASPPQE